MKRIVLTALLLGAACASYDAPGTYQVITPDASGGGERHVHVTLKKDGAAAVSTAFSGRPSRSLVIGTWKGENNRITLELDDKTRMVFRRRADMLFPEEWDRASWGEDGPGVLERVFLSGKE